MSKARTVLVVVINLLLIGLAVKSVNAFLSYRNFTLYNNGKWENTKTFLPKGVVGAWSMMFSKAALARNMVNISDWAGYQELIYKKPVAFHKIRFTGVSCHFPFAFVLSKTDSLTNGIWFNYNSDTACCFFTADKHGKFLSKAVFSDRDELNNLNPNTIEAERKNDSIFLKINKRAIASAYLPLPALVHIGMHGGRSDRGVSIDDIAVTDAQDKMVMLEDFAPPFSVHWITVLVLLVLSCSFFFLLKPQHTLYTLYLNAIISVGLAGSYFVYFNYLSANHLRVDDYFHWVNINFHGTRSTFEFKADVDKRLNREYPLKAIAGIKPVVLFIGSSQTWGAGVSAVSETMPALVQKNIRNYFADTSITVINCGIPGLSSDSFFYFYSHEWYRYLPKATVINLSFNDKDTAVFRKNIRAFIEFNNTRNIKTLLIAEPNDANSAALQLNHDIMKQEGIRGRVIVEDVQVYMDSCYTSGFLWWDIVHCTDYGYECLAARVSPAVIHLLETTAPAK